MSSILLKLYAFVSETDTVDLHLSGRSLSRLSIIWISLALQVYLPRILLQN